MNYAKAQQVVFNRDRLLRCHIPTTVVNAHPATTRPVTAIRIDIQQTVERTELQGAVSSVEMRYVTVECGHTVHVSRIATIRRRNIKGNMSGVQTPGCYLCRR